PIYKKKGETATPKNQYPGHSTQDTGRGPVVALLLAWLRRWRVPPCRHRPFANLGVSGASRPLSRHLVLAARGPARRSRSGKRAETHPLPVYGVLGTGPPIKNPRAFPPGGCCWTCG